MINIRLKDGSVKTYESGSIIVDIAKDISEGLARVALAAEVNGELKDLRTPLYEDCELNILTFDSEGGKHTYWHTASHIMAQAVKRLFPSVKLAIGPAIDNGFYYDFDLDRTFTPEDMLAIEKEMQNIIKEDLPIERFTLSRDKALELMKDEPYKVELINELPENAEISFYRQGDFTDLCAGPHLLSTGKVKAVKLMQLAGAYWRGNEKNKMLQRIYGIAFPKASQLEEYLKFLEEAEKRDHRRLGKELDLFSFDEEVGPGLVLWHPKGARVRMRIEDFWRKQHIKNGYDIVYTPHIGRGQLWETSGHLGFYNDSMYSPMDIDGQNFFVKPMNCPFHIAIYKSRLHSYRDLPYRWAELGTVYRYEKSGVLHGLLRVRGFTQDDAHLFCAPEQMPDEIRRVLKFCLFMLKSFGFNDYKIYISTKPKDKFVGDENMWAEATKALMDAVAAEGLDCDIDEGGGAFYGPKIDIKIRDALNREWQCSTIQFDFNEPERFDMTYVAQDGSRKRPYMIHRALLGSIERFFGVLLENYAGAFPVWLAPVQAKIIPILDKHHEFAEKVAQKLTERDVDVEIDTRNEKIGLKIRDAQLQKVPYMLVIGDKEVENNAVSVRSRKDGDMGSMDVDAFVEKIVAEIASKV